jgi:threonine/homoserine/homoserine lactone efflux protein
VVSALAQLLPLAVGAALSSVPITVTLLILLSEQRKRSALPYLIGWVVGMAVVVLAGVVGAGALPVPTLRPPRYVIGVAEIVVGVGLLGYGVIAALRAVRTPRLSRRNRWIEAVSTIRPAPALGLGLLLNLRPKGLLIAAAVGLAITGEGLPWADSVVLVLGYLMLAVSTVVLPIVVTLVTPNTMQPRLRRIHDWLERNGAVVTAVLMGVIGVVIALAGVGKLVYG